MAAVNIGDTASHRIRVETVLGRSTRMKHTTINVIIGIVGAAIADLFGGWDQALKTLVILMTIDYLSGIAVAGIFKNSHKTESGGLESKAGWKGLCRKCMTLVFVLLGAQIDLLMGVDFVRLAIIIGYCSIELLSIVENAGLMGLPMPDAVYKAVDLLKGKSSDINKKFETEEAHNEDYHKEE